VIWRKLDCLHPNLQETKRNVHRKDARNRCHPLRRYFARTDATSEDGAMSSEDIKGDEWGAYVTLTTYDRDEHGIT
jgi:hypothetical protein